MREKGIKKVGSLPIRGRGPQLGRAPRLGSRLALDDRATMGTRKNGNIVYGNHRCDQVATLPQRHRLLMGIDSLKIDAENLNRCRWAVDSWWVSVPSGTRRKD